MQSVRKILWYWVSCSSSSSSGSRAFPSPWHCHCAVAGRGHCRRTPTGRHSRVTDLLLSSHGNSVQSVRKSPDGYHYIYDRSTLVQFEQWLIGIPETIPQKGKVIGIACPRWILAVVPGLFTGIYTWGTTPNKRLYLHRPSSSSSHRTNLEIYCGSEWNIYPSMSVYWQFSDNYRSWMNPLRSRTRRIIIIWRTTGAKTPIWRLTDRVRDRPVTWPPYIDDW